MSKVFVGSLVEPGTFSEPYKGLLIEGETIEMEFKGLRDGMIFTDRRLIVVNSQGFSGKKVEASSFPWRAMTAFAVENAGTFDIDAEVKFCGSGWGVCEVQLARGTQMGPIARYLAAKVMPSSC